MSPVLYYVHHHGLGHWRRALAVAGELERLGRATVLASSSPPPQALPASAEYLPLPPDHPAPEAGEEDGTDHTAGERLHWAPPHHRGLLARHQALLTQALSARPVLAVVDVSVEITVLLRTSGIPVVAVRQPGLREDPPHELGYAMADQVVMPVPESWRLHEGLARTCSVGLVTAPEVFAPEVSAPEVSAPGFARRGPGRGSGRPRVVVLIGAGGSRLDVAVCRQIAAGLPDHDVRVLGLSHPSAPGGPVFLGRVTDPRPELAAADVIVGNTGLGTIADVACCHKPFVAVPEDRPFGEQFASAQALAAQGQGVMLDGLPEVEDWSGIVARARALGPLELATDGAVKFAALLQERALRMEARHRVITLPSPSRGALLVTQ